jgi:predicted acetyltransferase
MRNNTNHLAGTVPVSQHYGTFTVRQIFGRGACPIPGKNQGMAAAYPIRPISEEEFGAFYAVIEHAFNAQYPTSKELPHETGVFEFDRSLAAFDGADIVGTAAAYSLHMTVPGGAAAVAGVSAVATAPSHRRRGILSSLMHRQLTDVRERGEAVAALFASEAGIYARFGYGAATRELNVTIRSGEGAALARATAPGAQGPLRLRTAGPEDATAELASVFDSVLHERPGMFARDDRWWENVRWDPEHRRSGSSPLRCVIAKDDAGPRGYALYSVQPTWTDDAIPAGVLHVRELMATDPPAYAAVWNDLLNRDLVGEVRAQARPVDEPLLYLLADGRRARPRLLDALWVRLVSVPEALASRRYSCPVDVVIEVADGLLAENAGRWRLRAPGRAGDEPSTCERTSAAADVTLPVQSLGATYMGGTTLGALARAGLADEATPGAIAALSAALSWDPAPWSPTGF